MNTIDQKPAGSANRGPSPGILATVYFILFAVGMIYTIAGTSGASYPTPYDPVQKAQEYYHQYHHIVQVHALFLFWSALPLGIFTAFFTGHLSSQGVHRGGLNIASFGGYGAAIMLTISGLCTWVLSQPIITDAPGTTRIVQLLAFATGGTGYVALSGLLISGLAVTGGLGRMLPRWLMWSGLVIAAISVLAMFNIAFPGVSILLPIGRFTGMIWMLIAGYKLKRS
ncbi:hypothetical protein [Niabella beijingensis]|uniref:hypothetical protein n=1 Tax=Niabella beijingensis TaxID=2872700 RepID=UPI001CBB0252|nr:hypothetical protein [Niabella beijingensis]MBZ4192005.1 hypothetical protein [Niabella beijingensis]